MDQRVLRREDDHGAAGPASPPLPHRADGQQLASLRPQQRGARVTHQGARAVAQEGQGGIAERTVLKELRTRKSATGCALRFFTRADPARTSQNQRRGQKPDIE